MVISLYAALCAIMLVALSVVVIKGRWKFGAALGDSGQHELMRRIRAHNNFTEYAPLFLILLAVAEVNGLSDYALHGFGAVFLLGRVMHAFSLIISEQYEGEKLIGNPIWRVRGMMATFASLGLLAGVVLVQWMIG